MSRMFTTCPACRMNLAVTAMDLRVGQGYVRCGRCERVFNALVSLAEDIDADQQSGHTATGTTTMPALDDGALPPELPPPLEDPEPAPAMTAEPAPDDPEPEWAAITPIQQPLPPEGQVDVVDSQATGTVETIVLEGDGYLQTEEHVDEQEVDEQLQKIARQISGAEDAAGTADGSPDDAGAADTGIEVVEGEPPALEPLPGDRPRAHWAWGAAAALLALLLGGQMVHHTRQRLVANPWLQQPLQSLYGAFGVTLEPAWDLKAYDLRQLGGAALPDDAGSIVLRATVHNRAPHAQPPPLIRAVLQDRFGNALTTTAIAPRDYLRGTPPARMAPDQRLDVQLKLPDPTRQAVGFELDACLTATNGALRCSHDR